MLYRTASYKSCSLTHLYISHTIGRTPQKQDPAIENQISNVNQYNVSTQVCLSVDSQPRLTLIGRKEHVNPLVLITKVCTFTIQYILYIPKLQLCFTNHPLFTAITKKQLLSIYSLISYRNKIYNHKDHMHMQI